MGLFDWGTSEDELLVVKKLTTNAEGGTVTKKTLMSRLSEDESILSYLNDGEQPHFILQNRSKGLTYNERGQKDTITPSNSDRAFAVLTDQRVLFLVGTDDGIDQRSIDHDEIESVEASSGILKHRVDLKTLYANYQFYVSSSIRSGEFKDSVTFLRRQAGLEKPEVEATAYNTRVQTETGPVLAEDQTKQRVLQQLRKMDPYDFEEFVANLWEARGWNTTVTQGSSDQGVDIVATKESPFPQKQVIQAKRYASDNTIGSPKVREYASLRRQEHADITIIVTTSGFTRQAENKAETKNLNVKLVDADGIYDLLKETGRLDLVRRYSPVTIKSNVASTEHASDLPSPSAEDTETDDRSFSYKKCLNCGEFTTMESTWRKDLIFPVLQCTQCQAMYHESDDDLTPLPEYIAKRDSNTSEYGYYGVLSSLVLALLSPGSPLLGFIAWLLLPVATSRDTRYVRSNSDMNPPTGYWVWGAVLIPVVGGIALGTAGFVLSLLAIGGAYLIQRYREDTPDSDLHQSKITSSILSRIGTQESS